ncbi:MAG: protein kinase domain-containing protein [Acidobacteriota bacterium]
MPLPSGSSLGAYENLQLIGAGGMGEVYRAHDTRLGRDVAIKVLPDAFIHDPERLARFEREARLLASLNHPKIGSIYGLEESGSMRFLVLELIPGETLAERIAATSVPRASARGQSSQPSHTLGIEDSLEICRQIAEALQAAHEKGIIHRDLKPANIKVTPEGKVKVLDFGLAKAFTTEESSPNLTMSPTLTGASQQSGVILGTAAYMSPEQARGKPLDKRTDIWSFGCVLYECLTGQRPFAGDTVSDSIAAILGRDPDWNALPGDTPSRIKDLLRRCLRKDRDRRLHDIADARIEIEEALEHPSEVSSVSASIPGALDLRRPRTIHPWVTLALAAVATGAVAVAIWSFYHPAQSGVTELATAGRTSQVTTSSSLDIFPTLSPDGSSIAYSSDRSGNFEIYVKQMTAGGREIQLTSDGEQNFQPAWSADGQRIAYHKKNRGGIWLMPALGGIPRQLTDFGSSPAWSRDGAWIVFQSDPLIDLGVTSFPAMPPSTIWTVSLQGGQPRQITKAGIPQGGHGSPCWSPDGKRIIFVTSDISLSEVWSVTAAGQDVKRILQGQRFLNPVFSPDGQYIYYSASSRDRSGLWRAPIDPASGDPRGQPVEIKDTGPTIFKNLAVSGDGKRLACSAVSMNNNLWSVPVSPRSGEATGAPRPLTRDTSFRKSWPMFSPDGRRIVFNGLRLGASTDLWRMDADGKNPVQLMTDLSGPGLNLAGWLPGGNQVVFWSNRAGIRKLLSTDVDTGREAQVLDVTGVALMDVARLSPDGTHVVFNSKQSGTINVWTLPLSGGQPKQLTFDKELAGFACWSPDGKLLALEVKRAGDTHIAIMPSNGGPVTQLTFDRGQSWTYSWSPDGDKIAFAGFRNGFWNIWWVSRSTRKQQRVTNYSALNEYVRYPAWSPLGNQIVFEKAETTGNIWLIDLK